MQLARGRVRGFTLAEIAVVMVIVGLLIGGLLTPLAAQVEQRNFAETQKRIESATELLLGFAIANGRLPCPASTSSSGDESPSGGGTCTNYYDGFLPARALGMQPTDSSGYAVDSYDNRIRYVLAQTLATPATCTNLPAFSSSTNLKANGLQCQPGDLRICRSSQAAGFSSTSCGTNNDLVNQSTVVAVVFSTGKNSATSDATRTDEISNTDANATFVYHTPTPAGAGSTGGEFDDLMVWISAGLLYGRMVGAGVLP